MSVFSQQHNHCHDDNDDTVVVVGPTATTTAVTINEHSRSQQQLPYLPTSKKRQRIRHHSPSVSSSSSSSSSMKTIRFASVILLLYVVVVNVHVVVGIPSETTTTTSTTATILATPTGPIDDIIPMSTHHHHHHVNTLQQQRFEHVCPIVTMEEIEHVNTAQIYEILIHLKHLSTIRNIQIDLSPICTFSPLLTTTKTTKTTNKSDTATHTTNEKEPTTTTTRASSSTKSDTFDMNKKTTPDHGNSNLDNDKSTAAAEDEDEYQCSGGSVSDEIDDDAEPLCTVQTGSSSSGFGIGSSLLSTTSSSKSNSRTVSSFPKRDTNSKKRSNNVLQQQQQPQSNVLHQLHQQGFTSQSQQDTFTWRDMTDTIFTELSDDAVTTTAVTTTSSSSNSDSSSSDTVTTKESDDHDLRSKSNDDDNCHTNTCGVIAPTSTTATKFGKKITSKKKAINSSTGSSSSSSSEEILLQPDHFWDDMCSALWNRDRTENDPNMNLINLALNPERNTGYNGTHIWRAIYDENCIVSSSSSSSSISKTTTSTTSSAATINFDQQQQQEQRIQNEMCYEERVLYRLLSGLHSSTTISIAKHYYPPSKKKNRTTWESNPQFFVDHFQHHPEYIRNLHFTYAVLLRALSKASSFLYHYDFNTTTTLLDYPTDNNHDNETHKSIDDDVVMTQKLVRRLLDTSILQSCQPVFMAFDESLMFQEVPSQTTSLSNSSISTTPAFPYIHSAANTSSSSTTTTTMVHNHTVDVALLRQNFKGVFQNVSSILDCVQCQQCKLHGKLVMLGYGAALKVLLMQNITADVLEHNEIIALINTIIKFSESIKDVRELTNAYIIQQQQKQQQEQLDTTTTTRLFVPNTMKDGKQSLNTPPATEATSKTSSDSSSTSDNSPNVEGFVTSLPSSMIANNVELMDLAVNVIATLGRTNRISFDREAELIQLIFQGHVELLLLIKHYHTDIDKLLHLLTNIGLGKKSASTVKVIEDPIVPDAIVIGSGLAGMATTLNILDRGGRVVLIEKEHVLGGNSGKASSGINACCPPNGTNPIDSQELFWNDTYRSAGTSAQNELITTLISKSADAVMWIQNRLGVDLSLVAQLGGHSTYRTHRPKNGMVGAEIIYAIQKAIKAYLKTKHVTILTDTKVTKLLTDDNGAVIGVEYVSSLADVDNLRKPPVQLYAPNVVLATGGFASDRSDGSYLSYYRPELLKMPATAGPFSTGDGIKLATQLGAATVDMDKVQVHPTGWVDPADPDNRSKILAGELMRGVGGILLNSTGQRFCNELGTRSYVTNKMLSHDPIFAKTGNWSINATVPTFSLILSSSAAADGKKHVDLYTHKGLLTRLNGIDALAKWMKVARSIVERTMKQYQKDANNGHDIFGRQSFKGVPVKDLENEVFYAGTVTPVLHYCMGGIAIDAEGNVLNSAGDIIPGLHAAGEVSGGVHGVNRLGGNSLLECTVYGTIVGQKLPIRSSTTAMRVPSSSSLTTTAAGAVLDASAGDNTARKSRVITTTELQKHNTPDDCWIAIHGIVYDLTDFAEEHPAGALSIHELAGLDGTDAFAAVHNQNMLDDFDEEIMGVYHP